MKLFTGNQLAEVHRVLRDDHSVLSDAAREDDVIRLTEASPVAGMDGIMLARLVEMAGEYRRKAFVDEEPEAAFAQGRPAGRPTIGCVRA